MTAVQMLIVAGLVIGLGWVVAAVAEDAPWSRRRGRGARSPWRWPR